MSGECSGGGGGSGGGCGEKTAIIKSSRADGGDQVVVAEALIRVVSDVRSRERPPLPPPPTLKRSTHSTGAFNFHSLSRGFRSESDSRPSDPFPLSSFVLTESLSPFCALQNKHMHVFCNIPESPVCCYATPLPTTVSKPCFFVRLSESTAAPSALAPSTHRAYSELPPTSASS